jgi:hypothetical protein
MDDERSVSDKFAELQQLRDDDLITDDEFDERRTALLDQLSAPPPPLPPPPPLIISKSGTPGRWTPEEQAAYRAANPKRGMSATAKVALAVAMALVITFVFANINSDTGTTPGPSNPAPDSATKIVLDRINSSSDCIELQRQFDIADSNNRVDYMEAADARMRLVGCY